MRANRESTVVLAALAALGLIAIERHLIVIHQQDVLIIAAVIPAIILHEVSHGVVALWFGDDTAKRAGRLTLNPIKHVDPFGTVILPLLLTLSHLGAFGYAKPVPVNLGRLRHPRNDGLLVSLAGPVTNFGLAGASLIALRATHGTPYGPVAERLLWWFGYVNVLLGVFNLLPIPPLDGSAMVERALPNSWWPGWLTFRQYSMPVLLLIVLLKPGALSSVFTPALDFWQRAVQT